MSSTTPTLGQDFADFVNTVIDEWKVPGLALSIVKDGEVLFSQGFGKRNVAENLEVTPHTLFAIGSASKAFTAMTLAILVDEGKLNWNTPVKQYLPSFKLYDPVATERMTPLDLLIHNSGLPDYTLAWYNAPISRKEAFDRLQYFEPTRDFRTTWQYQNLMYATAGYLVEALSGQSWEEFTQQRILTPLDMTSTTFSVHESQHTSNFALPYRKVKDEIQLVDFFDRFQAFGPAGSINSNVVDMTKWLLCLLNKGKYGETRIVSEAQFGQLVSPHIIAPAAPTLYARYPEIFDWTYGCGWFVTSYRGHRHVQHGGNIDGFSALVSFLPDDNIGMVALTNLDNFFAHEVIIFNISDRLLGLEAAPWQERFKQQVATLKKQIEMSKQENGADRVPDAPPSHALSAYAGEFEHPGFGTFAIVQDGEHLKGIYNDLEYTFTHHHYDVFMVAQERFDISLKGSFSTNLKGDIESFSIGLGVEPGTKPIVFLRAADKSMQEKSFLDQFTGDYEVMGLTLTVVLKGEKALSLTVPGQPLYELEPYKGTDFRLKGHNGFSIAFKRDEAGTVTEAVLTQPQGVFTAKRKASVVPDIGT